MTIASACSISATGIAKASATAPSDRSCWRDAVVEVAGAQRFGQARKQRALLVRGRRMHQHAELVGGVVAQDLRGLGQRFFPGGFTPLVAVLAPAAWWRGRRAYRPWCE